MEQSPGLTRSDYPGGTVPLPDVAFGNVGLEAENRFAVPSTNFQFRLKSMPLEFYEPRAPPAATGLTI